MNDAEIELRAAQAGLLEVWRRFPAEVRAAVENAEASRTAMPAIENVGVAPWPPVPAR